MRCCKKRGIIYTDGGEAPVMREPSLKIIGMLVGSIACRAFSAILQKPRAFPRPQHDWPIYDAPSDEFKGDGFSGSLFQNADGADNLVDQPHTTPTTRALAGPNSGAAIGLVIGALGA